MPLPEVLHPIHLAPVDVSQARSNIAIPVNYELITLFRGAVLRTSARLTNCLYVPVPDEKKARAGTAALGTGTGTGTIQLWERTSLMSMLTMRSSNERPSA